MFDHATDEVIPVLVIGGGPIGLAAAAHLAEEGREFVVLEGGAGVGHAVRQWGHVRLFTPWKYLVDVSARRLLENIGWTMPDPDSVPTGRDLVERYLEPLGQLPEISNRIVTGARVVAITRQHRDKAKSAERSDTPFDVRIEQAGHSRRLLAGAIIDASGTYHAPNPLGSGGLPALGEAANAKRLFYGIPDVRGRHRYRYAGKRVGVVGSGHSAFNTLLDLQELVAEDGTEVIWFVRSSDMSRLWGGGDADQLPERGVLGQRMKALVDSGQVTVRSGFVSDEVRQNGSGVMLSTATGEESGPLDEIIVVTGFRPDLSPTRELRLDLDTVVEAPSALAPLIDPNLHSCGTVPPHGHRELAHPEAGFYTVGMKSYGRAPTFLMLTGYEQVRSVVKAMVGDIESADRVELVLPESGVCNTDLVLVEAGVGAGVAESSEGACCD